MKVGIMFPGAGKPQEVECHSYLVEQGILYFYDNPDTETPFLVVKEWAWAEPIPDQVTT